MVNLLTKPLNKQRRCFIPLVPLALYTSSPERAFSVVSAEYQEYLQVHLILSDRNPPHKLYKLQNFGSLGRLKSNLNRELSNDNRRKEMKAD